MTTRDSGSILLVAIVAVFLIRPGCCGQHRETAGLSRPALGKTDLARNNSLRTRSSVPFGKMKVPADLYVDLIRPDRPTDPVGILVSVSSDVVTSSGRLTLRVPDISGDPGKTEVLWEGKFADFIDESLAYAIRPLPVGRYHFVAVIEFTPDREGAETLVLSESLYVDVRTDEILTSNVSFRQMERQALYRKLEDRALMNLSPRSATPNAKMRARYRQQMEATHPGLIEKEIARLRATDPDVARQIMALNSSKGNSETSSDMAQANEQGQPVLEKAVPVR